MLLFLSTKAIAIPYFIHGFSVFKFENVWNKSKILIVYQHGKFWNENIINLINKGTKNSKL